MITDKTIEKDSLLDIITELSAKIDNAAYLIQSLGIEENDNGFGSIFLKPFNNNFKHIIVNQKDKNNPIESITFLGDFNISFLDLIDLFGEYEKKYSPHDDCYFYFFSNNSKHPFENVYIKTYSPNDALKVSNWNLENISILWS